VHQAAQIWPAEHVPPFVRADWNFLTNVLLSCLQRVDSPSYLFLLASALILIGNELLYAATRNRKLNHHRLKLLL